MGWGSLLCGQVNGVATAARGGNRTQKGRSKIPTEPAYVNNNVCILVQPVAQNLTMSATPPARAAPAASEIKGLDAAALASLESFAGVDDVVTDLPEGRVKAPKDKAKELHSIHGEQVGPVATLDDDTWRNILSVFMCQAARRRAIGELIFFSGTNDLKRCREIAKAWHINVSRFHAAMHARGATINGISW